MPPTLQIPLSKLVCVHCSDGTVQAEVTAMLSGCYHLHALVGGQRLTSPSVALHLFGGTFVVVVVPA